MFLFRFFSEAPEKRWTDCFLRLSVNLVGREPISLSIKDISKEWKNKLFIVNKSGSGTVVNNIFRFGQPLISDVISSSWFVCLQSYSLSLASVSLLRPVKELFPYLCLLVDMTSRWQITEVLNQIQTSASALCRRSTSPWDYCPFNSLYSTLTNKKSLFSNILLSKYFNSCEMVSTPLIKITSHWVKRPWNDYVKISILLFNLITTSEMLFKLVRQK